MKRRPCILTNRRTHEEHRFASILDAAEWLDRDTGYLRNAYTNGTSVCRFDGGDTYNMLILGEKRKYTGITSKPKQLCFDCRKAVGGCPWSRSFIPIDGWTAEPTIINQCYDKTESYQITACPLFVSD